MNGLNLSLENCAVKRSSEGALKLISCHPKTILILLNIKVDIYYKYY